METNEILEGNKLIAQFMGSKYLNKPYKTKDDKGEYIMKDFWHWTKPDNGWPIDLCISPPIEMSTKYMLGNFVYHLSWDWLMPCVGKILIGSYTLEGVYRMRKVQDCLITCSIEKTFDSVCDFIKWYNLNNK